MDRYHFTLYGIRLAGFHYRVRHLAMLLLSAGMHIRSIVKRRGEDTAGNELNIAALFIVRVKAFRKSLKCRDTRGSHIKGRKVT